MYKIIAVIFLIIGTAAVCSYIAVTVLKIMDKVPT